MARVTIGTLELVDLVPCAVTRLTPYICCEVLTIGGGVYMCEAGSVETLDVGKNPGDVAVIPATDRTLVLLPS